MESRTEKYGASKLFRIDPAAGGNNTSGGVVMEIETSWHDWKKTLGRAVNAAELMGMSNKQINKSAYRLGEFFAKNFDPGNREQRLLKELWEVGAEEEKSALASMIAKLADRDVNH